MTDSDYNHTNGVEQSVLHAIKSGEAKMRPRWYFTLRAALIILAAVFVVLLAFLVMTFILFSLQEKGGFYAIHFGVTGYETFFGVFPWSIFLLLIALLLAVGLFLRHYYAFAYQRSFSSLLLLLITVIALASVVVPVVPFHIELYRLASHDDIPLIPGFYQYEMVPTGDLYRGEIISFGPASSTFIVENAFGNTSTIRLISTASSESQHIWIGEYVLIFGQPVSTDTIRASGVEQVQSF